VQPKVVGDGLVLDMDFSKSTVYVGTGTVVNDSRLNGIAGTLINGPTFSDPKTHRSAMQFVGTQHARISNVTIPSSTGFSATCWFLQDTATADWQYVLHFAAGAITSVGSSTFFIALDPDNRIISTLGAANSPSGGGGSTFNAGTTTITTSLNTWYNVVLTWNGSQTRVYVNGVERQSYTVLIPTPVTSDLSIGGSFNASSYRIFNGKVGAYSLYNKELTAQEVADYYNATRWRFGV
jgi:hypothetical protein